MLKRRYALLIFVLISVIAMTGCSGGQDTPAIATETVAVIESVSETESSSSSGEDDKTPTRFEYRYETSKAYTTTEPGEAPPESLSETTTVATSAIATETTTEAVAETTSTPLPETAAETTTATTTAVTSITPETTTVATVETTVATAAETTAETTAATTIDTYQNDVPEVISTSAELFAALKEGGLNLDDSIDVKMMNLDLFNEITDEQMFELGIKELGLEYSMPDGTVVGRAKIEYTDYQIVFRSYMNGTASKLTGNEKAVYDKVTQVIKNIIDPSDSEFDKILKVNDYIGKNTVYSTDTGSKAHTAYGALIDGKAVCQGYTYAFKLFMDMMGIESKFIRGEGNNSQTGPESHSWNLVKLDGEWYHVDTTWNDPVGAEFMEVQHTYLNVTDKIITADHSWDKSYYPAANGTKYNYYRVRGLVKNSAAELEKAVNAEIGNGTKELEYVCTFPVTVDDIRFIKQAFGYGIAAYGDDYLLQIGL